MKSWILHEIKEAISHVYSAMHQGKIIFLERERERYKTSWLHEWGSSWEAAHERGAASGGAKWWFCGGAASREWCCELPVVLNQLLLPAATICCTGELCKIPSFIAFHKGKKKKKLSFSPLSLSNSVVVVVLQYYYLSLSLDLSTFCFCLSRCSTFSFTFEALELFEVLLSTWLSRRNGERKRES